MQNLPEDIQGTFVVQCQKPAEFPVEQREYCVNISWDYVLSASLIAYFNCTTIIKHICLE